MLEIRIEQDRASFRPGEQISGSVAWQYDEAPPQLELTLLWRTEGKGTQDVGIAQTQRLESPGPFGEKKFAFTAPTGPYSFSGRLISIIWALELASRAGKDAARKDIVISATGKEIICRESIPDRAAEAAKRIVGGFTKVLGERQRTGADFNDETPR